MQSVRLGDSPESEHFHVIPARPGHQIVACLYSLIRVVDGREERLQRHVLSDVERWVENGTPRASRDPNATPPIGGMGGVLVPDLYR